jgi:hypothetical protein
MRLGVKVKACGPWLLNVGAEPAKPAGLKSHAPTASGTGGPSRSALRCELSVSAASATSAALLESVYVQVRAFFVGEAFQKCGTCGTYGTQEHNLGTQSRWAVSATPGLATRRNGLYYCGLRAKRASRGWLRSAAPRAQVVRTEHLGERCEMASDKTNPIVPCSVTKQTQFWPDCPRCPTRRLPLPEHPPQQGA